MWMEPSYSVSWRCEHWDKDTETGTLVVEWGVLPDFVRTLTLNGVTSIIITSTNLTENSNNGPVPEQAPMEV